MRRSHDYFESAFNAICNKAEKAVGSYVCLMAEETYYGGPEEGGWYGQDCILIAYQHFNNAEDAEIARQKIEELAEELSEQSRKDFGNQCLRELEWLEERGLEPDFLPEPDGDTKYYVIVSETIPSEKYGDRHYS